tara:strand:+ start:35844 stop:36191 length:348 start_codon:yes stop_codon:yes gene_type:complete
MDAAEERQRQFEQEIFRTREEIRDALQRIEQRFDAIDRRFERMEQRFERMEQRFEHIDRRFEHMDRRFDQLIDQNLRQSEELRRTHRWMLGVAVSMTATITLLLPVTLKLADRWL